MASRQASGLLADAVGVVGIAVRGTALANDLRAYKSDYAAEAPEAAARLREMLANYLREEGDALWRKARMENGPSVVAVVPSGQGRLGAHPLASIVASCLDLPPIGLSINQKVIHIRGVDVDWLRVAAPVAGADVLVVDDTWVSGGSAQSAAAALKLAGARRVAIVVLGRHLQPGDPRTAPYLAALAANPNPNPQRIFRSAVPEG
jgi:hypothetical protein